MNSGEARTWRWLSLLSELPQAKLTEKITSTGRWAETPVGEGSEASSSDSGGSSGVGLRRQGIEIISWPEGQRGCIN